MKPRTPTTRSGTIIWLTRKKDGTCLALYRSSSVHEVISAQAFEGLRFGPQGARTGKDVAVVDHNVPTTDRSKPNPDAESAAQIAYLAENAKRFGLEYYNEFDKRQGVVHIIGPDGLDARHDDRVWRQPHRDAWCVRRAGVSASAPSEVEHVLATQTLIQSKSKNMPVQVDGKLPENVTAKDIILAIIGEIGTAGGTGYTMEYAGDAIRASRWKAA